MQTTLKRVQICCLILILLLSASFVIGQEAATILAPNTTATGLLSTENVADIYSFQGTAGTVATVIASSGDATLGVLLSDSNGNTLAEAASVEGTATVESPISQTGTYQVTVFAAPDTGGVYEINLSISGEPAAPTGTTASGEVVTSLAAPSDVLINNGMEVRLQWSAAVDLNLEVRDPNGNTLYYDSRTSPIGGSFGFDANGVCDVISETPAETATWQPGFLPTGSYEILVFYRQNCEGAAQAVPFTLTVTVNGEVLPAVTAAIAPPPSANADSAYLANFIISDDATATLNEGGAYPDTALNQLPTGDISGNVVPVEREVPVQGAIFEDQDFVVYAFEAEANETISVSMAALSRNLDTLLQLVDPNGNLLAVNDDAGGTTDSLISNVRILQSGTYLVIATRYGKGFGGTEGEFQLLVTESSAALPDESLASFNLPEGDIQVYLTWETDADLQLLVRDPVGQSVYDDNPSVTSGGLLAANGNVACVPADGQPVSYIYWPSGVLRPGTYEVDVWYESTCQGTAITEFRLTVVVAGQTIISERRIPSIGDHFVISFTVNADGTSQAGIGGLTNTGVTIDMLQNEERIPIVANVPQQGSITLDNPFDVYAFDGQAGQIITVSLEALAGGTLDANLFLLSAAGVTLRTNDDADPAQVTGVDGRTTDSLIAGYTLPADGQYLIVASRFGTIYGGTIGAYQVTVSTNQ